MELTAALHHSAPKSAGPETYDAPRSQKTVKSKGDAVLFELFDEDTAGWRPAPLMEPMPQDLPRHRPRDVDYTPLVQVLDVPVPQYILVEHVEQLVPQERVHPRTDEPLHGPGDHALPLRVQQRTAEQVADLHVPLASGFGTFVEQVVGVPVLQRAAAPFASVSGRVMEQVVDVPVLQRAHAPFASVSEDFVVQVVDVPVPWVAPDFARGLHHETPPTRAAAAWLDAPQEKTQGVFRTFPPTPEKCDSHLAVECELGRALELIHVVCLWTALLGG